jgi:arginine:pyruvate transaminase
VVDTEQLREACQRIAHCAHELMEAQAHA